MRPSADIAKVASEIISGKADVLQLRAKHSCDCNILKIGRQIKKLTQGNKTLFVLNDRADLARIINADGVHLGQEDLPLKDARKILGSRKIIGISTHSLRQAYAAEKQGADYIGIGPIFPTATKPGSVPLTIKIITKIKHKIKIPFVAIGGISLKNLGQVLSAGAGGVAVSRAILTASDITEATRKFRKRLYKPSSLN